MSNRKMVMNYVPGEECRVAIVENSKLEEFHAERMDGPSNHVGNIYVGKVANVEPGIQAAFVDFGLEHNGFLHTSDVHPQYFPGEDGDKTERVGRKTPRRERPPIQDCFRRGDEVAVQVLKEGVGTKGPTVTSYLSIPGRFLVMMPQMDKVGVSRKVEDEETRRKMRDILDQLDLPEGFGFILRTAGFDRSKAELKRDLAYLMRLWKDMERRWRSGAGKPRLLYSESDLLVRALRDMLTSEIEEIVVDNEAALSRAARFLKIVSPRTTTRLVHYTGRMPIFHALGIESQIQMIHAREVPLPSGGRLVIDEAEALVAIDVNSGKMRDARDAEATAYKTNMEAADEICRQLRLRDVGGVVVNDFIDMRQLKHRRELETRMKDNLKNDRARSTIGTVSEFGILEMTRQRMRASHESQHFAGCPTCRGRGLVQKPDSVAVESLRDLAALVDHDKVSRVEMVVHPRIAGELLSTKRKSLSRVERTSGKHVDVRVSDAIAVDRITFYAYDDRGADLDLATLAQRRVNDDLFKVYEIKADAADEWTAEDHQNTAVESEMDYEPAPETAEPHPIEVEPTDLSEYVEQVDPRAPRRAPGGGGGSGGGSGSRGGHMGQQSAPPQRSDGAGQYDDQGGERRGRRRRRRGRRGRGGDTGPQGQYPQQQQPPAGQQFQQGYYDQDGVYHQPPQDQQQYAPEGQQPYAEQDNAGYDANYDTGGDQQGYQQQDQYQGEYAAEPGDQPDGGYDEGAPNQSQMNGLPPQGNAGYPPQGPGEPGEGGRRRRRRRRRGRRGRGGGGEGGAPGQYGQGQYAQDQYGQGQPQQFDQYGQPIPNQYPQQGSNEGGYAEGEYADAQMDAQGYAPPEGEYAQEDAPLAPMNQGDAAGDDQAFNQAFDQPPHTAPLAPDEGGETAADQGDEAGGRKRRRKRGGRGRNRARGDQPLAEPSSQGEAGHAEPAFEESPSDHAQPAPEDAPTPVDDAPSDDRPPRGGRSRGGRGRGRGGRSDDKPAGRTQDRGGPSGGSRTVSSSDNPRDARQSTKKDTHAPQPKQGAAAPKPAAGAKPVRTLYGGVRRKLNPGDVKGMKREE